MKHIKKNFLHQREYSQKEMNAFGNDLYELEKIGALSNVRVPKDNRIILFTENNFGIQAFEYSNQGKKYFIPEPDPVLIYFHSAQLNLKLIQESKKELLRMLDPTKPMSERVQHQIFSFFSLSSGFIIFLFTTIEAFINKSIPKEYRYKKEQKNKTELYDQQQIQRYISFDEKKTKILTEITRKDFHVSFPMKDQHLVNLKNFRDSIIHTKQSSGINKYDEICKKSLNFKYQDSIEAVFDFLNFYQPNYIEECSCGADL